MPQARYRLEDENITLNTSIQTDKTNLIFSNDNIHSINHHTSTENINDKQCFK